MTARDARPPRRARVLLIALVVAWLAAFVGTHWPRGKLPSPGVSDKSLHALGYFVLGSLFHLALAARGVARRRRVAILIGVLAVYGALDEITQPLWPIHRHASFGDWLADLGGAVAAAIVWELVLHVRQRRRQPAEPD